MASSWKILLTVLCNLEEQLDQICQLLYGSSDLFRLTIDSPPSGKRCGLAPIV